MTRNQIPGIPGRTEVAGFHEFHTEASWGYGWSIAGNDRWLYYPAFVPGSFNHSGGGAMMLWIDPVHEIVGVYLSVCRPNPVTFGAMTNVDLFVNAVNASVED
jgi:CubicO group peptidase (beta-lactamase class C family)